MRLDQYGRREKTLRTQDGQRFADGGELAREMRLIFMREIHQGMSMAIFSNPNRKSLDIQLVLSCYKRQLSKKSSWKGTIQG